MKVVALGLYFSFGECVCAHMCACVWKALTLYTHKDTFSESPVLLAWGIFSLSYGSRAGKRFYSLPVSMHFPATGTLAKGGASSPFPGVKSITFPSRLFPVSEQGKPCCLRRSCRRRGQTLLTPGLLANERVNKLLSYILVQIEVKKRKKGFEV